MIKDILVGRSDSHIANLVAVGNSVYFSAYDGVHGNELWKSDGTSGGTMMVKDIIRGTASSLPRNFSMFNNIIYFSVLGRYGAELWRTDGSESGTRRIFPMTESKCSIITPHNGALDKSVSQKFRCTSIEGADMYTWEISTTPTFSDGVDQQNGEASHVFAGLRYNTKYFVRVKSDANLEFSEPICFTTASPDHYSFIISPENRSGTAAADVNVISNAVPGASSYTIELNTSATFAGEGIVQSGPRAIRFTGLLPSTTYFARVKTDLSMQWGGTRSFTTMSQLANSDVRDDEVSLISEEEAHYGVEIYPNPFHDRFSITVRGANEEKLLIMLTDATGKTVYEVETSTNNTDEIDSELPPGLYILHVRTLKLKKMIRVLRAE
jgi:ELWxxDGT repeat protein